MKIQEITTIRVGVKVAGEIKPKNPYHQALATSERPMFSILLGSIKKR